MPEQDEQFVQRRLLTASLLSALVIMGYFWWDARTAPPPAAPVPAVAQAPGGPAAAEPEPPTAPDAPADEEADSETKRAAAEQVVVVETDTFEATFTNRGALVRRWVLKNYRNSAGEPLDLVHQAGAAEFGFPFELRAAGGAPIPELAGALFAVNEGPARRTAPTTLEFEYFDGTRRAKKSFGFSREGYIVEVETAYSEGGAARPHLIAWPGGFGDTSHQQDWIYSKTFHFDPVRAKYERIEADDAEDARIVNRGEYPFVGLEDHFFAAIFLPRRPGALTVETSAVRIAPDEAAEPRELFAALAVGADGRNEFQVFVGPKDIDELQRVDRRLRDVVDFGWFSFVAEPIFLLLRWTHANVVANWGWSIVIVTVFINIALFPLKWKSSKSMKRMQQLQPLVQQINEKYKGLGMRDPRKQKQNEELMELYSKYNVNPVGGCLPMLLQLPFFYAFYTVLTVVIEMRHAEWLWVSDLSQPETLAIRVLPLAMVGTQFWMQSLTPTPTIDPAQARIMKFMPVMMGFIFYQFQAGLVLYWLTGNIVGVVQQALLNKLPAEELKIAQPSKKGGKAKTK